MTHQLYAFGSNGEGQLGLGFTSDKVLTPTLIPLSKSPNLGHGLRNLKSIRGGGNHTLIQDRDGNVWGAGSNEDNQLGILLTMRSPPANTFSQTFIEEVGLSAAAWKSSAYVTEIRDENGAIHRWEVETEGRGLHGELGRDDGYWGNGYGSGPALDVDVSSSPIDLVAGMYHYVLLLSDGKVYGWGRARNGQLGQTDEKSHAKPTLIPDVPFKPKRVVCGQNFTYIVGDPATGEHIVLGEDKHGIQSKKPENVKGWVDIGATWNAIFVLFDDGSLKAWGKSDLWELVPLGLPKIKKIAVGSDHILALTSDNKVLSWGWAVHGNCGDVSTLQQPLVKGYVTSQWNEIAVEGEVVAIGAGYSTSFILATPERAQPEQDTHKRPSYVDEYGYI